ncbi:MAG TPA: hypothetical protein VI603_13650 [Saprospiraceae bacterium]|nr:hypothetical protein [Saprospiraceae bacterium]
MSRLGQISAVSLGLIMLLSCSKDLVVIDGNPPYSVTNISDIKINNYVNRLYIDLIGREPLDHELIVEVERLKAGGLKRETRDSIITVLMTDTTYRENEFSYKAAYVQNLYNLAKVRCLEGASDGDIQLRINVLKFGALQDSLEGNWDAFYRKQNEIRRNEAALESRQALYDGLITCHQMYSFMIDNGVYDLINMNTFNFVRATFDQLIWRLPTDQEFNSSFNMIQNNQTDELFGSLGSDKNDYIRILTESDEMLEGMLIWCFQVFLSRPPTAAETVTLLPTYINTKDINWVITQILVTDEYANFR